MFGLVMIYDDLKKEIKFKWFT